MYSLCLSIHTYEQGNLGQTILQASRSLSFIFNVLTMHDRSNHLRLPPAFGRWAYIANQPSRPQHVVTWKVPCNLYPRPDHPVQATGWVHHALTVTGRTMFSGSVVCVGTHGPSTDLSSTGNIPLFDLYVDHMYVD